jgi:hypothetical protein
LSQQAFQQSAAILQQRGAQGLLDPLGGNGLALLQPLGKEFQECFGFAVALGLDLVEFFLRSAASDRVWATVRVTNCSASS